MKNLGVYSVFVIYLAVKDEEIALLAINNP